MRFPRTKTMSHGTVSETLDSLQEGRNCVFATNNRYRRTMDVRLKTQIEISESGLKGKNFTETANIPMPSFKGKTNDDNG